MDKELLISGLKRIGIEDDGRIADRLSIFVSEIMLFNPALKLVGDKDPDEIIIRHVLDSAAAYPVFIEETKAGDTIADLGSGAGFPGMVLKIFFPELQIYLVDSNNKKTRFLTELKAKLGVDKLEVINNRIENLTKEFINKMDVVTARAVTNLPVLVELALPLVAINKYFIAMKGNAQEEIYNSQYAITYLGGKIIAINEFTLPHETGKRTLIVIKKEQKSDLNKVRPYEKIIKKPLQK